MDTPWQVTSQRETVGLNPNDGNYSPMIEVTFRTADNIIGKVNVPKDRYNAETVRDAINDYVAKIGAVIGMTSGGPT